MKTKEEGNLIILGLGIWVFVIALALLIGSAAHLHNERKELLAHADSAALALAQRIDDARYYATGNIDYAPPDLTEHAQALAERAHATIHEPTGVKGENVVITLCQTTSIPMLPTFLNFASNVEMCATSFARLRITPTQ